MIEADSIREALKRYRRVTVTELAAVLQTSPARLRRRLAADDVAKFVQATGDSFHGSPVLAYRKAGERKIEPVEMPGQADPFEGVQIDPQDPFAGVPADATIRVENIMRALARLAPDLDADLRTHNRHLPYAHALPHVKTGVRHRYTMSEHQRYMDRLGGGIWATVVRADLRRAGLMSRYR